MEEDKDFMQLVSYRWISHKRAEFSQCIVIPKIASAADMNSISYEVILLMLNYPDITMRVRQLLSQCWLNDLSGGFILFALSSSPYAKGHGDNCTDGISKEVCKPLLCPVS